MTGKRAAEKPYEGAVGGMFVRCSLQIRNLGAPGRAASDDCGVLASAAAHDPETGNWLWRCLPHQHLLDMSGRRADMVTRDWPPPSVLRWEDPCDGDPRDRTATSGRVHGFWMLGPDGRPQFGAWCLTLALLDGNAEVVAEHDRPFPTAEAAKAYAEQVERGELPLPQGSEAGR